MANKYYFVNGYSKEQVAAMKDDLRSDAQIVDDTIIVRMNEVEAANARAELIIFNQEHNTNIELVG